MSERASPWKRAPSRPPMVGWTATPPASTFTVTFGGSSRVSCPFGPFTSIFPFATAAVTPFGRATGRLPVRDSRSASPWLSVSVGFACAVMVSPNLAEELAANALATRFLVGHDPAARAQDGHAHARADTRNAIEAHVDPAPGGG